MNRKDFEASIQTKIDALLKKLDSVSRDIDVLVNEMLTTSNTSNVFWSTLQRNLRSCFEDIRMIEKEWIESKLPKEYTEILKDTISSLKQRVFRLPGLKSVDDILSTNLSKQSLGAMLNETLSVVYSGIKQGESTLLRLATVTQQYLLSEKAVNDAIARGFLESGTGNASKKRLMEALADKAKNGEYISVIDKNGDTRMYHIKDYAELVARTKLTEAASQAVLNTCQISGADLVGVTSHNTQCAICAEYEGKIFSISGSDPDFPVLDETPPFHPNCQHQIATVFKEALIRDGTLERYIAFSNGDTEVHPTRSGHIPVSERELH